MKAAVVSGASTGIGAAIANALLEEGWFVIGLARRAEMIKENAGEKVEAISCDVSDQASIASAFSKIQKRISSLDALINAAGEYGPIGPTVDVDANEWVKTFHTNTLGPLLLTQACVPLLRNSSKPKILNFAGGGAFDPLPKYSAYAVSKAGIVRLTETLAEELKPDIAVNAVAPGFVATEIHNATLAAGPEIAGSEFYIHTKEKLRKGSVAMERPVSLVRWLLSDKATGLTGMTLSASFDPWEHPKFADLLKMHKSNSVYRMKRMNPVDLSGDEELLGQELERIRKELVEERMKNV